MSQKQCIALLAGGISAEREISLISAQSVAEGLKQLGYNVVLVDPANPFIERLQQLKPDVVFNCLHGTYGEDGIICGVLEMLKLPYTHSGVTASAVGMNKTLTKQIAMTCGLRVPKSIKLTKNELLSLLQQGIDPMPMPYVIKPEREGSAIGVYIIKTSSDPKPKEIDLNFTDLIIEEYIAGQELSGAVFRDKALGIIELRPKNGFYDYQAKYTEGKTEHIYPAQVPAFIYEEAMQWIEKIHKALGCRTLSRSDLIYNPALGVDGLYFLEINTHPGFTNLSLVPEIANKNGITFLELLEQLIQDARCVAQI